MTPVEPGNHGCASSVEIEHDRESTSLSAVHTRDRGPEGASRRNAWNTCDPEHVSLAYTIDSQWRNRDEHVVGRDQIVEFLTRKWDRELDYVLRKNLWGFRNNRMAARFQYECRDADGQWYRSYGNELWEFTPEGLMSRREASINDVKIDESQRRYFGPRPESEYGNEIPLW